MVLLEHDSIGTTKPKEYMASWAGSFSVATLVMFDKSTTELRGDGGLDITLASKSPSSKIFPY